MTDGTVDTSPQLYARMAGISYLLGSLTSVLGQMVILGMLVVSCSATATAANILSHEPLFRLGFVSSLMTVPFHLVWAVLFYGLFKPVNKSVSLLAGFVMLVACAMWALSSLLYLAPLLVLQGKTSLSAFAREQLQALALMLLKLNAQAYDIGLVFFGFWCVLIGYLILRSTFLPRIIAVLEVLAGLGYMTLLWRPLTHYLYPYNLALAGPGEISLLLCSS
ncbi:MAG TPA: DUF4386 domain-containing protein [Terriglobales bacterium]|jgi:uncharacterized protein DUF4386|nr:DUF4386 domain-containing protein [Terriglobales bacterium]